MFKPDTVLVVGAGASSELKFPLGTQLSGRITDNLRWVDDTGGYGGALKDQQTHNILQRLNEETQQYFDAARIINAGVRHAVSIDAFIDTHRDKPYVGKLGKLQIALEIARAEARSDLMIDDSNSRNRLDFARADVMRSWLVPFAKILLDGCRASELEMIGWGLTIVCFNYDRCIEQYLCAAIADMMAISYRDAHDVVSNMQIIHPYGTLGRLPDSPFGASVGVPFGKSPPLSSAIESIRTYTEEMSEQETLAQLRKAVGEAKTTVFLGFSFAPQNMALLQPPDQKKPFESRRYFTTGVGIEHVAHAEISERMLRLAGSSAQYSTATVMPNATCAEAMASLSPLLIDPSPKLNR